MSMFMFDRKASPVNLQHEFDCLLWCGVRPTTGEAEDTKCSMLQDACSYIEHGCVLFTGNMDLAQNTYQVVLRLDPDNASSHKGLKRIKLMNSSKNAGNEAFKAGKWREAEQHYTQALELDSHLKSSFVAQCACNRSHTSSSLSPSTQVCHLYPTTPVLHLQ